jgi:acyl CoA:acetate/3-ketoacid CoA transferase beta subunit
MVITDLCVLEMRHEQHRFELIELAPDVSVEEVLEKTTADLLVSESIAAS